VRTGRTAALVGAGLLSLMAAAGCTQGTSGAPAPAPPSSLPASTGALALDNAAAALPAAGTCHYRAGVAMTLPDPACTPGAVNPAVTPTTITQTICRSGWTKTIRPPTSRTDRMKAVSARAYSVPAGEKGEYDHLVPLELGGAPDDSRNLWFEPGTIPNPKDPVENTLNDAVCEGLVPLATAQRAIATNWTTAFDVVGLRVAAARVCLRDDPSRCVSGARGHGN